MAVLSIKKKKIIFILGPTAIGKSEVAVYLARKINAEVISCDSMQVYKGMDIITSKPGRVLTKSVKHHLIGVAPLKKEYDVFLFRNAALKKIKEIFKIGKIPLIVGGTGLYASVLSNGIFECKEQDNSLRNKFYRIAKNRGSRYLHDQLRKSDPVAAAKIHPNDTRRIVRALEVFKITGSPISLLQKEKRGLKDEYDVRVFCLNMPREKLYKKIDSRVERMFNKGLINEVRGLLKKRLSRTASFAIGIKEISSYLRGDSTKKEAKDMVKLNTRRYAKRQLTWFRKDKGTVWVNISEKDKSFKIAGRIWKKLC
ncbi:MAG: tRNA (adenosine(37)-N6)-dimethylallyltransferase MiaA [Candidatus Omnitrophica bacterium]|nr:tRNA (adenosine(37)-N6)-dimethylallyltransferase MiaA [Candidatus Omnitrophota bacterium]